MPSENVTAYRFGVFTLEIRAHELRKGGVRLKLQEQPREVLLRLLDRPGEVVSREELRAALWREDTFVDFENGLNTAIKRLRESLGDSADNPIFVETIPRRGYRFLAPVEVVLESAATNLPKNSPAESVGIHRLSALVKRNGLLAVVAVGIVAIATTFVVIRNPRMPHVVNTVRLTNDGKSKITPNVPVTDGVHLYFVEGAPWGAGSGIAQMSVMGGETSWIQTSLPNILSIYAISPDRSELLVASGIAVDSDSGSDAAGELWVQPLPAGAPHRVGSLLAASASWTPDGKYIVFADKHALWSTSRTGEGIRKIADLPGVVRSLRFSPDGKRIRFFVIHQKAESDSIWEINADGSNLHPLFADASEFPFQCCGSWSTDGEFFYFQTGRGPGQSIRAIRERSGSSTASEAIELISGPLHFGAPVPSADGKRLFVVGEEPRVELFRYRLRTGHFDPFLPALAGPVDFSRDGKLIAYVSYPDMTLWLSRADGSERRQLTFSPVRAFQPRWSPGGEQIAFLNVAFNQPWKINVIASRGGNPRQLIPDEKNESDADPGWMPDGKTIIFSKAVETDRAHVSICRTNVETGETVAIPHSDDLFSSRVSPDGRYIAALRNDQTGLMLFDVSTGQWSSLTRGGQLSYNDWSHDGNFVYVRENQAGAAEVVRVRVKDHSKEKVVDLRDFPQLTDMFAGWIGLTPDDDLLLLRDRSLQEIYALDLEFH